MMVPEAAVDILLDCHAMFSFLDGEKGVQANDEITPDARQEKDVVKKEVIKEKKENVVK